MNETRTKILEVAENLIQRVGLNAMSYQHISEAIGIRKASVHHHFPKKENLVDELLSCCHLSYGENYRRIVASEAKAPDKLRELAGVFEDSLRSGNICFVGTISSDLNTLADSSRRMLEITIRQTVDIFSGAFLQGRIEGTLSFAGTDEDLAYAFFSFLLGAQITARAFGGAESFRAATEAMICGWER
jgi:TetR/AcrR family transcriptional repressor of nem operon